MQQPAFTLERIGLDALAGGDNLLQSGFWGSHKERFGWTAFAFSVGFPGSGVAEDSFPLLVLVRELAAGQRIAYVPHGPEKLLDGWHLHDLGRRVAEAISGGLLYVRFDLPSPVHRGGAVPTKLDFRSELAGMNPAPVDVQPPSTVVLNISGAPDDILNGMKAKTRYNIRLAERKGVVVVRAALDRFDSFYRLYRETSFRDHIAIHSDEYYRTLFELSNTFPGRKPDIRLYLALYEGQELAGVITAFYGRRGTYLYGASSNEKRNLMPAYLLQWRAMTDAREAGCSEYDLFGIPPTDNPLHPMSGLYRFKTGFGGEILHRPGCWDVPLRPGMYSVYRLAEKARSFYFHRLRKRGRGERS